MASNFYAHEISMACIYVEGLVWLFFLKKMFSSESVDTSYFKKWYLLDTNFKKLFYFSHLKVQKSTTQCYS